MKRAIALIEDDSAACGPVVTVRGEIDVANTPSLRDWLARASDGGRRSVVVDLRGVTFLAISGLYVLCDEQHRMAASRARLTIVCTEPRVRRLFAVCRLEEVLDVVPSRPESGASAWDESDDRRAERLSAWLQRYAAESA